MTSMTKEDVFIYLTHRANYAAEVKIHPSNNYNILYEGAVKVAVKHGLTMEKFKEEFIVMLLLATNKKLDVRFMSFENEILKFTALGKEIIIKDIDDEIAVILDGVCIPLYSLNNVLLNNINGWANPVNRYLLNKREKLLPLLAELYFDVRPFKDDETLTKIKDTEWLKEFHDSPYLQGFIELIHAIAASGSFPDFMFGIWAISTKDYIFLYIPHPQLELNITIRETTAVINSIHIDHYDIWKIINKHLEILGYVQ